MVSALAAAAAAGASAWSIFQQIRTRKEEREWLKVEKEHFYYRAVVAEPALKAVDSYRDEALEVLKTGASDVSELHESDATSAEIHDRLESIGTDYNRTHVQFADTLTRLAEVWHGTTLDEELSEALRDLEDEISGEELAKLPNRELSPEFAQVINLRLSDIVRIVQASDPVFEHDFGRPDGDE